MRQSNRYLLIIVIALFSSYGFAVANIPVGQKIRLADNWLFLKSDLGGIWEAVRPAVPESPESVQIWER